MNTTILRYFNVYGNRQHSEGQYAPVLGIFIRQKNENKPLTITGDGSQRRDFVHVNDVIRANILASQNFENSGKIYNVGSGVNYSVQEIADMICPIQTYIDKRDGEIKSTQAIIAKIKTDLNWAPEVSLEDWLQNELEAIKL
jgi:UDP-glucose 4-epimerase